jgi:hypothetical protein
VSLGNAHFDHGGIGHFNNGLIAHSVNGGFDHFDNGAMLTLVMMESVTLIIVGSNHSL